MKRLHFHFGWVMIVWLVFLLPACASAPPPTSPPTQLPTATHTPVPTLTPLPMSTPTATPDLLKDATTKSEVRVLELAKKQGLGDVKALSFWDQTAFRQTFRPEYKLVSILQSTTDKNHYWIPSADSAALVEARVPQDAKDFGWDFNNNQLYHVSATGTQFWLDSDSGMWLNKAGIHFPRIEAGKEQEAIDKWLAELKIDTSKTRFIPYIDWTSYEIARASTGTNSITFTGGTKTDFDTLLKTALQQQAGVYTRQKTILPEEIKKGLTTNELELLGDPLRVLLAIKKISLTDQAMPIVLKSNITISTYFGSTITVDDGGLTLSTNPTSLYYLDTFVGLVYPPIMSKDLPFTAVNRLVSQALRGSMNFVVDTKEKPSCSIKRTTSILPAIYWVMQSNYSNLRGYSRDKMAGLQEDDFDKLPGALAFFQETWNACK